MGSPPPLRTNVLAGRIRSHALRMVHAVNASHIGSCLSMADILAVLYGEIVRVDPADPCREDRDRVVISKGHAAAAVYAVLAECGFFEETELQSYCQPGALLTGHVSHSVPGVEVSTGALGHGLPIACGLALAGSRDNRGYRVFTILSDGELDEGSNWEAILFAPQHSLENLVAVVDYNGFQGFGRVEDVVDLAPLEDKWRAANWGIRVVDGHDHSALTEAFRAVPFRTGHPSVLLARTVKGKGVGFMEGRLEWHYRSPNDQQLAEALRDVGAI